MSSSCWTTSPYSFQFLSLNARLLSFWHFLFSLINCSFEWRVIRIKRCINRLKVNRHLLSRTILTLFFSPSSSSRRISSSSALFDYGSIGDLGSLDIGSIDWALSLRSSSSSAVTPLPKGVVPLSSDIPLKSIWATLSSPARTLLEAPFFKSSLEISYYLTLSSISSRSSILSSNFSCHSFPSFAAKLGLLALPESGGASSSILESFSSS